MKIRLILILMLGIFLIGFVPSASESIGTTQQDTCIEVIQTCGNCTFMNLTSITYPVNRTNALVNHMGMAQDGIEYTYNFCNTSKIGNYIVSGYGDVDGLDTPFAYDFEVTITGDEIPIGTSYILAAIMLITFGVACFFLIMTSVMNEPGPKLFFLFAALIFLVGTIAITSVIASDSNLTDGVNSSIVVLLYAAGMIFLSFFLYIMVKQTRIAIDLLGSNKGYELGY